MPEKIGSGTREFPGILIFLGWYRTGTENKYWNWYQENLVPKISTTTSTEKIEYRHTLSPTKRCPHSNPIRQQCGIGWKEKRTYLRYIKNSIKSCKHIFHGIDLTKSMSVCKRNANNQTSTNEGWNFKSMVNRQCARALQLSLLQIRLLHRFKGAEKIWFPKYKAIKSSCVSTNSFL